MAKKHLQIALTVNQQPIGRHFGSSPEYHDLPSIAEGQDAATTLTKDNDGANQAGDTVTWPLSRSHSDIATEQEYQRILRTRDLAV